MKNPFKEFKEQKLAEARRLEEEQRLREERLRQLEAEKQKKGFHIPHPVRAAQDMQEMHNLRKEINAYNKKKEERNTTIMFACLAVVLFIIIGVMAARENKRNAETASSATSQVETVETAAATASASPTVTPKETLPLSAPHSPQAEATSVPETNKIETAENTPTVSDSNAAAGSSVENEQAIPILTSDDLTITTRTDYAHGTETIFLGNDEGVTITIRTPVTGLIEDDILFLYDETLLSVSKKAPVENDGQTTFEYYVKGLQECNTQIVIITAYDYEKDGDNAMGYIIDVRKLDASDGRVCYVTMTGEKYHFSSGCAGENAMKTTYFDAIDNGYEPCGKCVG